VGLASRPASDPPHIVVLARSSVLAEAYAVCFAEEVFRLTTLTDCAVEPAAVLGLGPDPLILDLLRPIDGESTTEPG
jgi:hypothetical protein